MKLYELQLAPAPFSREEAAQIADQYNIPEDHIDDVQKSYDYAIKISNGSSLMARKMFQQYMIFLVSKLSYVSEGDVIHGKFEQRLRSKKGMYKNPDIEVPPGFARFESERKISAAGKEIGKIIGVTADGQRKTIATTGTFELADALAGAYNVGGYTDKAIKRVPFSSIFKKD